MNKYLFDLDSETRPLFRAGIHGLWRLLRYGEGHPEYSAIRQTETLKWSYTDTTIQLEWASYDDLHLLLNNMLSDMNYGIAVPPGYETDPDRQGFYITARQHQGIVSPFKEMRGSCRSVSLGASPSEPKPEKKNTKKPTKEKTKQEIEEEQKKAEKKAEKRADWIAWVAEHGHQPVFQVDNLSVDSEHSLVLSVQPHRRVDNMFLIKKDGKPVSTFSTPFHPALSAWNNKQIKASTEELFIVAFACLSYIFTMSKGGPVGLAIDAPTFSEADSYHRRWLSAGEPRNVLWVDCGYRTVLWVLSCAVDLPVGSYHAITPCGSQLFYNQALYNQNLIYAALGSSMEVISKNGFLKKVSWIPVDSTGTFLDVVLRNLESNQPWFKGLVGMFTFVRNKELKYIGLSTRDSFFVTKIGEILMNDIEKKTARWMHSLFLSLAKAYGKKDESDFDKATSVAISTHLARASSRASMIGALNAIQRDAGHSSIPDDVYDFIWDRSERHASEIREFLIMACKLRYPKAETAPKTAPYLKLEEADEEVE